MELNNTNPTSTIVPNTYYYTPIQLKLPLEVEEIIRPNDPVYTFNEVMKGIDLRKYIVSNSLETRGRKGYNPLTLLKIVLFAFQIKGYASTREIEELCYTDIRFRWLLQDEKDFPSHMTISNFINKHLLCSIDSIFYDISNYLIKTEKIDTDHIYIDGTKIEANANKYTWVWKNACLSNRDKLFKKITNVIKQINSDFIQEYISFEIFDSYEIPYLEQILKTYKDHYKIDEHTFVYGKGKRKSNLQRNYEQLFTHIEKLKEYAYKIEICGEHRNSYSKTDKDATFMRVKRDYMGNDQLLPAYNVQIGVGDEYVLVYDVNQYASDNSCFIQLMEKFDAYYLKYPKYPVADAGYGTYNNYLYCEEKDMEKYLKFSTYNKETKDKKYREDIFRSVNFKINENNKIICPNNKTFNFLRTAPIKGNSYGRTEEYYQCDDCEGCNLRTKCHKSKYNRIIKINRELTSIHKEVLDNLNSTKGALLRMNRSIQVEGVFGILKQDRCYRRINRKGKDKVNLEMGLIFIGYNLYKLHNKTKIY